MPYKIENAQEKFFIGLELRTDNQEGPTAIPAHWERFYRENTLVRIPNQLPSGVFALYTDYEGDFTKPYSCIIGTEVSSLEDVPEGLVGRTIPSSQYAVFSSQGSFPEGLIAAWQSIWGSDLKRSYTTDFELYSPSFHPEKNPEVKVYIAVNHE